MSGIFISYRRDDSAAEAHRLGELLGERFGADAVFIDVEDIGPGDDFAAAIDEKLGFCDALVAVIGPRWTSATDAAGRRRLDDPADWVRLEIGAALERGMKVFPVLVGGAVLPAAGELPAPLAKLALRQAIELRPQRFEQDAGRLGDALDPIRRRKGLAALWLAVITRGHTAIDPLMLDRPETLWRALRFLFYMVLINTLMRLPAMAVPGDATRAAGFFVAYVAADYVEWLGLGFALHFAMRALGGAGTLQKSIATFCFLAAYVPLIAVAQVPMWGVTAEAIRAAGAVSWNPADALDRMRDLAEGLPAFGFVRLFLSFALATYLWWRLFVNVLRAFRALHRLTSARALSGLALGIGAVLVFVALVVTPYFGTVYERFAAGAADRLGSAALPLGREAEARDLALQERRIERRRSHDEADVADVLVRPALAQELQLAQDHVLGRGDPRSQTFELDPAPVLEGPGVQWIRSRDIEVRLELRRMVDQVEHAACDASNLEPQRLVGRHVVERLGERLAQGGEVSRLKQHHHIDVGGQPRLAVDARGNRSRDAVGEPQTFERFYERRERARYRHRGASAAPRSRAAPRASPDGPCAARRRAAGCPPRTAPRPAAASVRASSA
jgi:hypothetical protein